MLQHYFDKYGHTCKLNLNIHFEKYLKNKNWFGKWFLTNSVISQKFILMRSHSRSHAALRGEMLIQMENYPLSIHPYSAITFVWESFMLFILFFWLIITPLDLFTYLHIHPGWTCIPDTKQIVLAGICLIDFLRRFFTGYIVQHCDSEEIILDLRRIARKYIVSFFFIDLFSTLPTLLELACLTKPKMCIILEMFSLLKFFRIFTMLNTAKICMQFIRFNHNWAEIITSIVWLSVIIHWLSCFSLMPGIIHKMINQEVKQWYDIYDITKLDTTNQYGLCLHRTLSFLSGTGFEMESLTVPVSENDMVYVIFIALFGWIITAIIFAKTYEKVIGMRSSSAKYEEMLSDLSNYMKHKNLPTNTQNKIKQFYPYKYEYSFFNDHMILNAIPSTMRKEIFLHYAKLLLDNVRFFRDLPKTSVFQIVSKVATEIIPPGDVLYRYGEIDNTLYFLLNGTVAVFTRSGREITHLEDGSHFGSEAILDQDSVHFSTVVAIETCEIFRLRSEDFLTLVNYLPDVLTQLQKQGAARQELSEMLEERYQELYNNQILQQSIAPADDSDKN